MEALQSDIFFDHSYSRATLLCYVNIMLKNTMLKHYVKPLC